MAKLNCWEFKKCGREPGGRRVAELGACPAASSTALHRANDGHGGGRACWVLAGTLCGGTVQGSFAAKLSNCRACDFYRLVQSEEGTSMVPSTELLRRLGR